MSNTKIVDKITKLLNLANDQQGTSEGEAALSRAMELMARYGIEQRDIDSHKAQNNDEMDVTEINIAGLKYEKQQMLLISLIAKSLGCYALGMAGYRNKVGVVKVYGRGVDRERVKMLFSVATLTMVSSAYKAVPSGSYNIRTRRLSHMIGYANAIARSLEGHESQVRGNGNGELVLLDDYAKAKEFALGSLEDYQMLTERKGSRIDSRSYYSGYAEGSKFDTGSTGRISGKRALSA